MITIGNWYIITKGELEKIKQTEIALKRRFTPAQIEDLRAGKIQFTALSKETPGIAGEGGGGMNMQLLIEETKRIAYGHAWSIQYEVTSYSAIPEEPQIHVYIERPFGCAHADIANTYQGALDNLKRAMNVDRPNSRRGSARRGTP
jgi:hypothetical protein